MLSRDCRSAYPRRGTRPYPLTGRKAARFGLLLVCIAGAAIIAGCADGLDAFFNSGHTQPPPPGVLRISPARGPVLGGTRVTISGTNTPVFGPGTDVLFGAFLATGIEVVDETTLRATAPAQAAGQVDVTVRVADGSAVTQPAGFQYVAMRDADAEVLAQIEAMFPGPPRLVSAVSTGNTGARITFSEPVTSAAEDPDNYSITIPEGGLLLLNREQPPQLDDRHIVVNLTTLSQADAEYRLTATGITDLAGNPLAPPDMLVNPAETTFIGIAPANLDEHIDTDGDGFADWFEMLGWPITVELADGTRVQGYVTSDPFNPDTDGDGMTDGEENARSMDPRTDDTDADLVLDADEVFGWRSNPNDQDTDDDGFADQTEVHFGTSLILADTDGDQLDDRDELLNRSRNPRIADVPVPVITVGEMNLELDQRYTYTDQFGREQQIQESYSDTLQRDTSSSYSTTDTDVSRWHIEGKIGGRAGIEVGAEAGKGDLGPTAKVYGKVWAEGHFEVSGGYGEEHAFATTNVTSQHTARTYNEAVNRVSQLSSTSSITRETVGARLSGAVTIGAGSDIAFQISDLEISVLQQDPRDRWRLTPIATLVPAQPDAVYSVGPLAPEVGPLIFQNSEVFPSMVEALMKDPRGLLFQAANYNITDELGRNFAFSGQEIVERTAVITIDFGNGQSETYRIATAGRFDAQGRPLGISMADALQAVNLLPWPGDDPELGNVDDPDDTRPKPTDSDVLTTFGMHTVTTTGEDGEPVDVRVITRVRGVQDDFDMATIEPNKPHDGGFWVTFATIRDREGSNPDSPVLRGTTNFDELRLHAGESYILAFVKDKDRDRLTSLEEFFSGSSDSLSDTDRDDLGDFLEVRGQWNDDGLGAWLVYTDRLPGGQRVYSAPYLSDSDEDGLPDADEYGLCRYRYEDSGGVPAGAFAVEITDRRDGTVTWENGIEPEDLPDAFPPSDGLPRDWHTQLDPDTGMPAQFPSNRASLDPRKMDTDEDGINDADEVNGYYMDLFDDNLVDDFTRRIFVYSDPLNTDTDGDGLLDGMERQFGTNPVSADSGTVFDDDLDGLPNRVEETGWEVTIGGASLYVYSNPRDPDSDNDHLPDYVEWVLGTNPWYDETQGQPDPDETAPGYDTDGDGLSDHEEWDGTVPPHDQEKLAFCDLVPNCAGSPPHGDPYGTDPRVADTDADEIDDGSELTGWRVYLEGSPVAYEVSSDPLNPDTDNDSWPDGAEWMGMDGRPPDDPGDTRDATDPLAIDTDGDGTSDAVEASRGRDPLARDQRVRVAFTVLNVIEDGNPGDPYGCFQFEFRVWPSTASYPVTAVHSDDLHGSLGMCIPDFGITPCAHMYCLPEYPLIGIGDGTMWVLPGSLTTYSIIMRDGDYLTLDGWIWAISSHRCPSVWIADWDFEGYFASTNTYNAPMTPQLFTFDVTGIDSQGDPVDLSLRGQFRVD